MIWKISCSEPSACSEYFFFVYNTVPKPGLHLAEFSKWAGVLCWDNKYRLFRIYLARHSLCLHTISVLCTSATLKSVLVLVVAGVGSVFFPEVMFWICA